MWWGWGWILACLQPSRRHLALWDKLRQELVHFRDEQKFRTIRSLSTRRFHSSRFRTLFSPLPFTPPGLPSSAHLRGDPGLFAPPPPFPKTPAPPHAGPLSGGTEWGCGYKRGGPLRAATRRAPPRLQGGGVAAAAPGPIPVAWLVPAWSVALRLPPPAALSVGLSVGVSVSCASRLTAAVASATRSMSHH